jgi:hypothetical protein
MALNRTYEHIYGSALFDELHNFFPELMYDEHIFSTEPYIWMRHRMHTLFPQFTRQRTLYNIYSAESRRADYETWRFRSFPSVRVPNSPRFSNPVRTNATLVEPVLRNPVPLPVRIRTRTVPQEHVDFSLLNTTLTNLLNTAFTEEPTLPTQTSNDLLRLLYGTIPLQTDVPVVASNDIIARHSAIVGHETVPADVNCAICQERNNDVTVWRKLNCMHHFHRTCIDRWFERDVHCPVCRHDIRNAFVPPSTITQSSTL